MYCFQVKGIAISSLSYFQKSTVSKKQQCGLDHQMTRVTGSVLRLERYKSHCHWEMMREALGGEIVSLTKPQWLFPTEAWDDKMVMLDTTNGHKPDSSMSLYRVQLSTSMNANSGISDPNAGILVSIIGEKGRSLMCRLPPYRSDEKGTLDRPQFQRGSKDAIKFLGPDLGQLSAIWVAPEADLWRLEEAHVTILPIPRGSSGDENSLTEDGIYHGSGEEALEYIFCGEENEILIGDKGSMPALELKPSMVQKPKAPFLLENEFESLEYVQEKELQRGNGLREYESLKDSMLGYCFTLVASGTSILVLLGMGSIGRGFAIGGIVGCLYLITLQRAVDNLPGSSSMDIKQGKDENRKESIEPHSSFRTPLARVAWVLTLGLVLVRTMVSEKTQYTIQAEELLAGAAGFLMSKVSVLLAGTKPK